MKILHLIFSFNIGGSETMLVDIVNRQCVNETVSVVIVNTGINDNLLQSISKRVKIICLHRAPRSKNPLPLLRLNKVIKDFNPDVIHCHNQNLINIILPFYRRKAVLTLHTTGIDASNFKKYKKCFAISYAVKSDAFQRSEADIEVIYNGVAIDAIQQKGHLNCLHYPKVKIVQVSRLEHETKGQHLALYAIKNLVDQHFTNIQLDFIGSGNSKLYLEQLATALGISDFVNFLGMKSREYIYQHLVDYDLLIQPSLYEGFGLTVAEAMAAKLPVLISNIEGPMELIKYGQYGAYFETGNAANLALKIARFIKERDTVIWEEKTEKAFAYCNEKFDIAHTAKNYIEAYKVL